MATSKIKTNLFSFKTFRCPDKIDDFFIQHSDNGNVQKPNNLSGRENATLYLQEYFKYDKECINK